MVKNYVTVKEMFRQFRHSREITIKNVYFCQSYIIYTCIGMTERQLIFKEIYIGNMPLILNTYEVY